jgi:prophage tail gpP-like protein
MAPVIKITIGTGTTALEVGDWDRVEIESNMLEPADAFSVSCTNKDGVLAGAIAPGDPVLITIDGIAVMVGRVDDVDYEDETDSRVTVAGRDLFLYLVDAHIEQAKTYKDLSLLTLAQNLTLDAWGITWRSAETSAQLLKRVKVEPGDTVWDVLQEQIQKKDILIWLDPDGIAQIGKPNYAQDSSYQLLRYVTEGTQRQHNNIIRGSVRETWRDRPSKVIVLGQSGNTFTDYAAATVKRSIIPDTDVARWLTSTFVTGQPTTTTVRPRRPATAIDMSIDDKPMVFTGGNIRTLVEATAMANREMGRRKFDSTTLNYTVKGFYGRKKRQDSLWTPNTIADVNDEMSGAQGQFFVTRRKFIREERGDFTEVELHPSGVWLP